MDPFEARLQFIQLLELLNPSQVSINKTVQFCLKNEELHEDFHSCILEVLDRLDLNSRVNVLYFLDGLVSSVLGTSGSSDLEKRPYVKNIEKDLKLIFEKVLPGDNLINLRNCVDILINIEGLYGVRNIQLAERYFSLELDGGEISQDTSSDQFVESWKFLIHCKLKSLRKRENQLTNKSEYENGSETFSKEQILSRMETDRERHKRFKETSWIVNRPNSLNASTVNKNGIDLTEFDKIWNKFDVVNKDDLREMDELNEIAKDSYQI
jgi:CTD kinase subunit gamma